MSNLLKELQEKLSKQKTIKGKLGVLGVWAFCAMWALAIVVFILGAVL